ncbi:MAG: FAD-dependent oxidoreductase [Deltaproteobacteria bacterium]|nr:FAD-dependent oxidoreductase [Deltaproteobacteria bacterium]
MASEYLILGNSAAGIAAAAEIRKSDRSGRITIVSDEKAAGYSRVMLPLYIAGKVSREEMVIAPKAFYADRSIRLLPGETAVSLDAAARRVTLASGKSLPYDRLLIATGAAAKELTARGRELPGIFRLRNIADAEGIRKILGSCDAPVVIVGGGLVGIKSLEALLHLNREVHLIISSDRILSQMLDKTASDLFLAAMQERGVRVHFHSDVKAFRGKQALEAAVLADGTVLPCCVAIIGKGVVPNVGFLRSAGIRLNQGIVVDDHMATNLPGVWAAGDVAEPVDALSRKSAPSALWPSAVEGGRIAGANMAGAAQTFSQALRMNSVELLGVRVVSAGAWEGDRIMVSRRENGAVYRKLVFGGGRLNGYVLAGDIRNAGVLTSLVRNRTEVTPAALEEGLERGFSYQPRFYMLGGRIAALQSRQRSAT